MAAPTPSPAERRKAEQPWLHRRCLERQLHDGASLRISAMSLRLGLLRHASPDDQAGLRDRIGELQDELHAVLQELRAVSRKIYPPLLDEAGLEPALRELAEQRGVELEIVSCRDRFGPATEGAAYFAVAECLTPGPPTRVEVAVCREGTDLVVRVSEVDSRHAESMLDQVSPLGGRVDVAMNGSGTWPITMRIPCE
jgi:signal transduction histidine kinase